MSNRNKASEKAALPRTAGTTIAWIIPNATVFISSFCIMVIELLAGRIIAKHLGSSLYTWTSVIGIVLAGIAIGNYFGGRLADRFRPKPTLALLFIVSSAAAAAITVFDNVIGDWTALWTLSWPMRVASHVTLVFFLPSAILGTISPVVAKMALDLGHQTGRTIGSVYAWGVIGSIVGTFMTGFYLINAFGTTVNIWAVAGALAFMSLFYGIRMWAPWSWAAALFIFTIMGTAPWAWAQSTGESLALRKPVDPSVIYSHESQYSYIRVFQVSEEPDVRGFNLDTLLHSQVDMDNPSDFLYEYEKVYWSITKRLSRGKTDINNLTIGGGGYVYPRHMHTVWPNGHTDAVEIDPAVTEAAMLHFGLPRDTGIGCFHEDGRVFVDRLHQEKQDGTLDYLYDFIYCDAVNDFSVPYQLTTVEFMSMAKELLTPDGAYLMNMIDVYEEGLLLGSLVKTMKAVFPHVYILTEGKPIEVSPEARNTFIIAGMLQKLDIVNLGSEHSDTCKIFSVSDSQIEALTTRDRVQILTDEYAPVENLLAPVFRRAASERAWGQWLRNAIIAERLGHIDEAIDLLEHAVDKFPKAPALHTQLGIFYAQNGNPTEAIISFQRTLDIKPNSANAHAGLADTLAQLGRHEEAIIHYRQVTALDPDDTDTRYNLATMFAENNMLEQAATEFAAITQADPNHAQAFNNWAVILTRLGDLEQAVEKYKEALRIRPDHAEALFNMAHVLSSQGKHEEALLKYAVLLKLAPDDCNAHEAYGATLFQLKRYDDALTAFTKAIECNPDHGSAHLNLAVILDAKGETQSAEQACREHLRINPGDTRAQKFLRHIQSKKEQPNTN